MSAVKDYRAIAPYITEKGVHVNGTVVALLPENSEPLAAAVETLIEPERKRRVRGQA
jgi:hypothetical protein